MAHKRERAGCWWAAVLRHPRLALQLSRVIPHLGHLAQSLIDTLRSSTLCVQAAHIGCGISGREGRAAVMASDYSFAQVGGGGG